MYFLKFNKILNKFFVTKANKTYSNRYVGEKPEDWISIFQSEYLAEIFTVSTNFHIDVSDTDYNKKEDIFISLHFEKLSGQWVEVE